jgi:hypothetical protein
MLKLYIITRSLGTLAKSPGRGSGEYWCRAPEAWQVPAPSWPSLLPRNGGWSLGSRAQPERNNTDVYSRLQ